MWGVSEEYRRALEGSDESERIRLLQRWLRTDDRGNEYDSEAVASMIDEWLGND